LCNLYSVTKAGCLIVAGGHYRTLMRGKTVSSSIGRRLIQPRFECTRRGRNQRLDRNTATLVTPTVRFSVPNLTIDTTER
jgi:hypothetical protein